MTTSHPRHLCPKRNKWSRITAAQGAEANDWDGRLKWEGQAAPAAIQWLPSALQRWLSPSPEAAPAAAPPRRAGAPAGQRRRRRHSHVAPPPLRPPSSSNCYVVACRHMATHESLSDEQASSTFLQPWQLFLAFGNSLVSCGKRIATYSVLSCLCRPSKHSSCFLYSEV